MDSFKEIKDSATGWSRVPKNTTNVKVKIIELLLKFRKMNDDSNFILSQEQFLSLLHNQWGVSQPAANITDNNKARIFGIIMSIPSNRYILERLAEGITSRAQLDNVKYSYQEMFQSSTLQFNNETIHLTFPDKAYDVDGI